MPPKRPRAEVAPVGPRRSAKQPREGPATTTNDEIKSELARVLGKDVASIPRIKKTDKIPPRISIVDVAMAVTSKDNNHAAEAVRSVLQRHPDINEKIVNVNFPDQLGRSRRGKQTSPATDVRTMVEIIMLLPGKQASKVRRAAADVFVRYLGGEPKLHITKTM